MEFTRAILFGSGLTKSARMKKAFLGAVGFTSAGATIDVGMVGFQAARSGRGGFVPGIVGQTATIAAGIPFAGFASAGLCLIPGVGPMAAAIVGSVLADYAEFRFGSYAAKTVRLFTDTNKRIRHLEMGGAYVDTESAQRQRFIAIQDMNAAMIPGRRYLGQEALLMHR